MLAMGIATSPGLAALDVIPVIVWSANARGEREWYNRRYYEYTGLTPEAVRGSGWRLAYHPEDRATVERRWQEAIAVGKSFEVELRLRGRDGLYRWFLARAIPFRDAQGNAIGWYGVNIEIEQQKIAFGEIARIAEILQHAYLPEQLPEVAGVRFDAVYVPAARPALIGGDWYDVEELPSGSVCISMGDVGGHGIEASVVASRIRQAIATLAIEYEDPALVLRKVNRAFMRRAERVFATGAVAIVAKDRRSMRYSSAGHPPPLIAHASDRAVALLEFDGIPLGIQTELQNWNTKVQLSRGDLIAFYTDGLVEASRDVLSGIWKLQASLRRFVAPEVDAEIAQRILEDVLGDEPSSDDVALLVARILS